MRAGPRSSSPSASAGAAALLAGLATLWGCADAPPRAASLATRTACAVPKARGPLAEGDAARRDRRPEDALAAYERAIAEDPSSVPAHLRYVAALCDVGRRSVARDRYAARAASPDATEAERVMAARLATDGSAAAVRAVYVDAARRSPGNPWWRLALAEVDLAAADRWIRRQEVARSAGDRPGSLEALDRARQSLARAQSAIENAAARAPHLAEIHLYRGLLRSLEGDLLPSASARTAAYRAAADAFERAAAVDPEMVDAWADLGDARLRAEEPDEALAAYLEAIRLAPSDPDLRSGAGLVLRGLERPRDAAAQYAEAARLEPTDSAALLSEGDAWAAAEEFDKALDAYGLALERDHLAIEAHGRRGAVLERLGRLSEARQEYATYVDRGGANAADAKRRIERLLASENQR